MRKYLTFLFAACLSVFLCSCTEDDLTPGEPYHRFSPEEDDMSEEAMLRREFYDENGFYIIFNDTLRHEQVGTDSGGKPVYRTELLDPAWNLFGYDSETQYGFRYFRTMEEKKAAAAFITRLAGEMDAHNLTRPYSVLAVDTISVVRPDAVSHPDFVNSLRCFIVAASEPDKLDEMLLLANMAGSGIATKYEADLQGFYALTVNNWGNPVYGEWKQWGVDDDMTHFYGLGLLVNDRNSILYCSKSEDVTAYIHLLLTSSREEVYEEFADYDKVLKKYEIIRNVAVKAGIKF